MSSPAKPLLLVLSVLLAAAAGWLLVSQRTPASLENALQLPEPVELPEFSLSDQDGNELNRDWFKGRWTAVFFGFTHCPDICPATLQILVSARNKISTSADLAPDILLISVDPERDTTEIMANYVRAFGERVFGASGEPAELDALTKPLGIYYAREPSESENYNVAHSVNILLVNDDGLYVALFSAPHNIESLSRDLSILMEAP